MPDDLRPASRRGTNPRSLANLHPSVKGEPGRNPTGFNGRTRAETVAKFLDEVDDTEIGKAMMAKVGCPADGTRIRAILHREWLAAMGKSDLARKTLLEQYAGRPKQQIDLSNQDGSLGGNRQLSSEEMILRVRAVQTELMQIAAAPAEQPESDSKTIDDAAGTPDTAE